jgi:hypothetical protein
VGLQDDRVRAGRQVSELHLDLDDRLVEDDAHGQGNGRRTERHPFHGQPRVPRPEEGDAFVREQPDAVHGSTVSDRLVLLDAVERHALQLGTRGGAAEHAEALGGKPVRRREAPAQVDPGWAEPP